ncbi:MAG: DUF1028 domain-containing protein [Clostridiales bacterium]|nr:DUF1028 domain-containing protein [Clostridiales bacterium]
MSSKCVATFSIVAADLEAGEWGVAVASKFLAVGSVVPWARASVGAVATQSYAHTGFGPQGLSLMEKGLSARKTLEALLADDPQRELRQVGLVDSRGEAATFTGKDCHPWAGGKTGPGWAAQGNILAGPQVVEAMGEAFEKSRGPLAERLLAALKAGDNAGGDRRGRQSAALIVVKEKGGYGGFNDRYIDLRVDDHPRPVDELQRLYRAWRLYFAPSEDEPLALEGRLLQELQEIMAKLGYYRGSITGEWDAATREAYRALIGSENFEERLPFDARHIYPDILQYLREKVSGLERS